MSKRRDSLSRLAMQSVKEWYANTYYYGGAKWPPKAEPSATADIPEDRMRDPDPLAEAKKARPENWRTTKTRPVLGADGKPMLDRRGKPIMETVPIEDAIDAHGVETRPSPSSRPPAGQSMAVDYYAAANCRDDEGRFLARQRLIMLRATMQRIARVQPLSRDLLEMWAAGWTRREMAESLDLRLEDTQRLYDLGLSMVAFSLLVHADDLRTQKLVQMREVTREDIGLS